MTGKILIFVQTSAARLAMGPDASPDLVADMKTLADDILRRVPSDDQPYRAQLITALNAGFSRAMHHGDGTPPSENVQLGITALAIALACDTFPVEDQLSEGNQFVGVKLIWKPNKVVSAYVTLEPFDNVEEKVTEIRARPFIENIDPRAN